MARSLLDAMATIRLRVMQADAIAAELVEVDGLPSGAVDEVLQLSGIFGSILEVFDDIEAQIPTKARSVTKQGQDLVGEPGVRHQPDGRG